MTIDANGFDRDFHPGRGPSALFGLSGYRAATAPPLDGRALAGFDDYSPGRSGADIAIGGVLDLGGRLPDPSGGRVSGDMRA